VRRLVVVLLVQSRRLRSCGFNSTVARAFKDFAAQQKNGTKDLDEMTYEDCSNEVALSEVFRQFATYLLAKKGPSGKPFTVGTILNYFSCTFNYLLKRVAEKYKKGVPGCCKDPGPNVIWVHVDCCQSCASQSDSNLCLLLSQWYNTLTNGLRARAVSAAVKRGDNISEKTRGMHRAELLKVCEYLLKCGDPQKLEDRAIVLFLYHSVGRAGEVACTNFTHMYWDDEHKNLWSAWNQTKMTRGGDLSYTPDCSHYEFDIFHALGTYIVTANAKLRPTFSCGDN
jgi:hypothetical protein